MRKNKDNAGLLNHDVFSASDCLSKESYLRGKNALNPGNGLGWTRPAGV